MCEIKSVTFGRITKWLKASVVKKINMLGNTSYFYIKYENEASIMIIGKEAQYFYIDKKLWDTVCERIDELPIDERKVSSKYTDSSEGWKCPNRLYSPNIPAICRQYLSEKKTK